MRNLLFSFFFAILLPISMMAQPVTLVFTGRDVDDNYVQLDHVEISNMTKFWQETIYWPDTVLTMRGGDDDIGIHDEETVEPSLLRLSQNNPNPFNGVTDVMLTVMDAGAVVLEITDMNGRVVVTAHSPSLQCGAHQFRISLSDAGTYVMTARQNGRFSSIKMVNNGIGSGNRIEYVGVASVETKTASSIQMQSKSGTRLVTNRPFDFGDMMEYVGIAVVNGIEYEGQVIRQAQGQDTAIKIVFRIVENPCEGTPTLTDIDGNVYPTIAIGNQCWMKENLRTTRFADSTEIPFSSYNSSTVPYRYMPRNSASMVPEYGYLYNWSAATRNVASTANPSNVQGICPTGWHLPSDTEWSQLTGYVFRQSQYLCDGIIENAYIGKALADTLGWRESPGACTVGNDPGSNNATLFSARPAGSECCSSFYFSEAAVFWSTASSNEYHAKIVHLEYYSPWMVSESSNKIYAFSVRCVKDW